MTLFQHQQIHCRRLRQQQCVCKTAHKNHSRKGHGASCSLDCISPEEWQLGRGTGRPGGERESGFAAGTGRRGRESPRSPNRERSRLLDRFGRPRSPSGEWEPLRPSRIADWRNASGNCELNFWAIVHFGSWPDRRRWSQEEEMQAVMVTRSRARDGRDCSRNS